MADYQTRAGGSPNAAGDYASTDGVTVRGAGVASDPITTNQKFSSAHPFLVSLKPLKAGGAILPGAPVRLASLNSLITANATTAAGSNTIGLETKAAAEEGDDVEFVSSGLVELTAAQWDAVVQGESGGLIAGDAYFLNDNGAQKPLITTAPVTGGHFIVQIGIALSPTVMLVQNGPKQLIAGG